MICSKTLNHFLISTYVLNLKVELGPTDLIYPAPPSSFDIATAINPSHFGFTDRDLGLTEMGLQTPCFLFTTFRPHQNEWISPTEFTMKIHCFLFVMFRSHRDERIGPTEFAWPTLYVPITENGPTEFMWSVTPRLCFALMIRLQRIYKFWLYHAIILPLLDVYGLYFTHLYHFWD